MLPGNERSPIMAHGGREGWTAVEVRLRRCVRRTQVCRIGMRVEAVVGNRGRLRTASLLPTGAARTGVRVGIHHTQTPT